MKRVLGTAIASSLALVSCTVPAATSILLLVVDGQLRAVGDPCAGAGPYQDVHAETGFTIVDARGEVAAEGRLPAGHAVEADPSIEWGVERIPTFCAIGFEVEDLGPGRYEVRLEGGRSVAFRLPQDRDEEGVVRLRVT